MRHSLLRVSCCLALLLAGDRLLPEWPALEFGVPALWAEPLLERAVAAR